MQDIDNMNSSLLVLLCALIQFLELDAVYVNIQRYRGYIQRTHNNLRALEGAADMKYMVRNQKKLGRLGPKLTHQIYINFYTISQAITII